jgi:hypothetical protein
MPEMETTSESRLATIKFQRGFDGASQLSMARVVNISPVRIARRNAVLCQDWDQQVKLKLNFQRPSDRHHPTRRAINDVVQLCETCKQMGIDRSCGPSVHQRREPKAAERSLRSMAAPAA